MQFNEVRSSAAEERRYRLRLLGTGNGTAPKVDIGQRVTATFIATGRNTLTWSDNPGTFIGLGSIAFRDTTQANIKNYDLTAGLYPATAGTFTLEIDFWNGSGTAEDLATTSYCDLELVFSELKNP